MKTERIRINKNPQQPEGIEVELVQPENATEIEVLSFLLTGFIRDLKKDGRLPIVLPEKFGIRYQTEGSFLLSGYLAEGAGSFYEPPQPIMVMAIQNRQGRFNLIHAPIPTREQQAAAAAATPAPDTAPPPTEPAPEPPPDEQSAT